MSRVGKPNRTVSLERRRSAVAMRRLGCSYQEIGDKLGITRQAAYKTVAVSLKQIEDEIAEDARAVRRLELERLDHWMVLVAQEIRKADDVIRAIQCGLRLMERRARLLGLDAKEPIEINVIQDDPADFESQLGTMSDDDLIRVLDGTWTPPRRRRRSTCRSRRS